MLVTNLLNAQLVDSIRFGDTLSEQGHTLIASNTKILAGSLGQPARQCLVPATSNIYGGSLTFIMKVDPVNRNYFTIKLWGGDDGTITTAGRLYLYAPLNGINYQVGYRHEGDYTCLSVVGSKQPLPGRFFYSTTMLPLSLTKGKTSVTLKIISAGRLYGLGNGGPPNGSYQFYMTQPSRGIYKAFTHIDPYLDVSTETQGKTPASTVMPTPTVSVLNKGGTYYNQVNNRINNRLNTATSVTAFSTTDVEYLAKSYFLAGMAGYNNPAVVTKVTALLDAFAADYYTDNGAVNGGANEAWGGRYGHLGYAIYLLREQLQNTLDATTNYGAIAGFKTHRQAWGDILTASRNTGRANRDGRFITNQCLLADESIYKANKGLLALSDSRALPEQLAQRYLMESIGISPWLGADDTSANTSSLNAGSNYYQVTQKGLSRENGYVGLAYGEMQQHAAAFYKYTGNEKFRQQAIKMLKARVSFRRPAVQVSGSSYYTGMEGIGLLAWRGAGEVDGEYADGLAYGDKAGGGGPLAVAATTLDADCIGYAKQCLNDNQFFVVLSNALAITPEGLDVFGDYNTIKNASDNGKRLPMTEGQPDFAWADEETGIAAVKKNNERLWIEPYWQAKAQSAISAVARFHYSTPNYDQYGVLETNPLFTYSGQYITRPNYADGMGGSGYTPFDNPVNIYAGEKLPVAANGLAVPPAGITSSSSYGPFMGKADAYSFRFGKFLIGMNSSFFKNFTLQVPNGFKAAPDVVSGKTYTGNVDLSPLSTAILYLDNYIDTVPIPKAPLLLYLSGTTAIKTTLTWRSAAGATSYTVRRSLIKGGGYTDIATAITDTTFTDNTLMRGSNYYYVVAAINNNGTSYNSMETSTAGFKAPAPQISNAGTDTAYIGTPYFYTIAAYQSPKAFATTNLPSGLTINAQNGIISGSPLVAGTFVIPVSATNSTGVGTVNFTLVVINPNKPVITSSDTAKAYVGIVFSYQIAATNSPTVFRADSLPASLSLDSIKGIITGTLQSTATVHLTIYAVNTGGVGSRKLVILVGLPPAPVIISASSVHGVVTKSFSYAINATITPYSFKAITLPSGLVLDTLTGIVSGAPTKAGTYSVVVYATNAGGTGKATVSFIIQDVPPAPWVDTDIGTALNGYGAYNGPTGEFTVAGAGNDIGGTSDGFNYLYQPVVCSTATSIVARLSTRKLAAGGGGSPKDKVALMVRESTAANAKHFTVFADANRNAYAIARTSSGGSTSGVGTGIPLDIPVWLRIDRDSNSFTGYASLDSSNWETIGSKTFTMNASMLVGVAVTSRLPALDIAVFDSVTVSTDCSLLPLTLVNYQAAWKKDKIAVRWTALNEQNNSHFILLRSADGNNYSQVATVSSLGDGMHTYEWLDNNPAIGNNYYKLLEVDKDGTSKELGTRLVRYVVAQRGWSVYPNPVNTGNCVIKCDNATNKQVDIKLLDAFGNTVWHQQKMMVSNTLQVYFGNALANGTYWLQINNEAMLKMLISKYWK
ncbi:putative Ig domain-containing protein [Parasediminibacterium sp. JCM 36343]|uniref:putative Ig domain-containing protein n=1 Tax=Parasediminibacterium sp. JCM 36343 TaxID=3374279 RepID=UPI00397B5998